MRAMKLSTGKTPGLGRVLLESRKILAGMWTHVKQHPRGFLRRRVTGVVLPPRRRLTASLTPSHPSPAPGGRGIGPSPSGGGGGDVQVKIFSAGAADHRFSVSKARTTAAASP